MLIHLYTTPQDRTDFAKLLSELRAALAPLRTTSGQPYLITMAGPGGQAQISKLDLPAVCSSLDFVNVMTYDMAGPWWVAGQSGGGTARKEA